MSLQSKKFRHEDIATVPRGYKVRTVPAGDARLRLAFPPGKRKRGTGRLISILHPVGEKGARSKKDRASNPQKVLNYDQVEAKQDKAVRFLEDVVGDQEKADEIADLTVEQYAERKGIRLNPAKGTRKPDVRRGRNPEFYEIYRRSPGRETELVGVERNRTDAVAKGRELARQEERRGRRSEFRIVPFGHKRKENRRRRGLNPDVFDGNGAEAEELYRKFHGAEPDQIRELQQEIVRRKHYTGLGTLGELKFRTPAGELIPVEWPDTESAKVLLASNALRSHGGKGNQLYFIGGDQDMSGILDRVPGGDKDFVKLGTLLEISYITRKDFDKFEEILYTHKLGEEGGLKPDLMYDRLDHQLYAVGGEYDVARPGIRN